MADSNPIAVPAAWAAFALLGVGVASYWPEVSTLATHWANTPDSSHGWLIAAAVPVLMWLRRDRVNAETLRPSVVPAIGLIVAAAALAAAHAAGINVIAAILLPVSVLLACWFALGRAAAKALAFPIAYFLFAVPIWAVLTPTLQWLTVKATSAMLATVGVVAFVDGSFVTVPAGTFEIAGGCSGTNYFVVAFAISTLLAGLDDLGALQAAKLIAAALGLAIVANWIRVASVIYIGNATAMQSSLVQDHYVFGWWLFAGALVPFFIYARKLSRAQPRPAAKSAPRTRAASISIGRLAVSCVLLLAGPAWARIIDGPADARSVTLTLPEISGWQGPGDAGLDWHPTFRGATGERLAAYRAESAEVDVYVAYYRRQHAGQKLIGYESQIGGTGWADRDPGEQGSAPATGEPVTERTLTDPRGKQRLLWSWYDVSGVRVTRPLEVKARQALGAFGGSAASDIVVLSSKCDSDCARARSVLGAAYHAGLGQLTAAPDNRPGAPRS